MPSVLPATNAERSPMRSVAVGALVGVVLGAVMFVFQKEPEAALHTTPVTRTATAAGGFVQHAGGLCTNCTSIAHIRVWYVE